MDFHRIHWYQPDRLARSPSERTNLSHALYFMRHFMRRFVIKVAHWKMMRAITTAL